MTQPRKCSTCKHFKFEEFICVWLNPMPKYGQCSKWFGKTTSEVTQMVVSGECSEDRL